MSEVIKVNQNVIDFQNKVLEWNELFGNSVSNKSLTEDYKKYTLEEISGKGELIPSAINGDGEGILDAICDIIYTGFMYLSLCDQPYMLNENIPVLSDVSSYMVSGVTLKRLLENDNTESFRSYLVNVLARAEKDFDLVNAFARVTKSNFSKAIQLADGETSHELYKYREELEQAGRYKDIFFEYHNGFYIAKAHEDVRENRHFDAGKIVKGSWYQSVEDLGGLKEFIN